MSGAGSTALMCIAVAVVIERRKARSPWLDFVWRPVMVLPGNAAIAAGTPLSATEDVALFYAGEAAIELYRTETANYRANLASGAPSLWVILRPDAARHFYKLVAVTADPAEGEAFTDAGNNLVEAVPMPATIAEMIGDFVSRHHVERPFVKRHRQQILSRAPVHCGSGGEAE
jgi:hypothetical protein